MSRSIHVALCAAAVLVLGACDPTAPTPVAADGLVAELSQAPNPNHAAPPPVEAAIRQLTRESTEAFNDPDVEAAISTIVSFYGEDAQLLPPPGPDGQPAVLAGRDAIAGFVGFDLTQLLQEKGETSVREVLLLGPTALEVGIWQATHVGQGDVEGHYMRVWQRGSGGTWKIVRETFN